MALNSDLIRDFQRMTKYNLQSYLLAFEEMVNNHFGKIVEFYNGGSKNLPSGSITLLKNLVSESKSLDFIINVNSYRFSGTDWWDLLELIEDIKVKLQTINNTPKWARTSMVLSNRSNNPTLEVQLVQGQTIERLAGGSFGYTDEHQDWYQIAIDNDVNEEKYTSDGGQKLSIAASGGRSFEVTSIVDVITKETLKGKDIAKKIKFEDEDIQTVTGDECFMQSCKILSELVKGDNPEFLFHGLGKEVAKGQNLNSISYPILMRQLTNVFGSDDSISSFAINKIERVEDGVFVDFTIYSKSGETFGISSTL